MQKSKKIDFLVVVLLLISAALAALYFNPDNITLGFLYLGIPSIYLLIRKKENYRKIGWGLLLFGVLFGTTFDFIGTVNKAWSVERIFFPQLMIGPWPIENIIGYLWMTLFILVFYEHFLDHPNHKKLPKRHAKLLMLCLVILGTVLAAFYTSPDLITFRYFYLISGFAAIVFPIIFAFRNPKIIEKFATLAFFFFFVWLALELVGVRNSNWLFPGTDFLGHVSVAGVTFPFEEVFFWFMWYPAVIVAYYEYFVDDQK